MVKPIDCPEVKSISSILQESIVCGDRLIEGHMELFRIRASTVEAKMSEASTKIENFDFNELDNAPNAMQLANGIVVQSPSLKQSSKKLKYSAQLLHSFFVDMLNEMYPDYDFSSLRLGTFEHTTLSDVMNELNMNAFIHINSPAFLSQFSKALRSCFISDKLYAFVWRGGVVQFVADDEGDRNEDFPLIPNVDHHLTGICSPSSRTTCTSELARNLSESSTKSEGANYLMNQQIKGDDEIEDHSEIITSLAAERCFESSSQRKSAQMALRDEADLMEVNDNLENDEEYLEDYGRPLNGKKKFHTVSFIQNSMGMEVNEADAEELKIIKEESLHDNSDSRPIFTTLASTHHLPLMASEIEIANTASASKGLLWSSDVFIFDPVSGKVLYIGCATRDKLKVCEEPQHQSHHNTVNNSTNNTLAATLLAAAHRLDESSNPTTHSEDSSSAVAINAVHAESSSSNPSSLNHSGNNNGKSLGRKLPPPPLRGSFSSSTRKKNHLTKMSMLATQRLPRSSPANLSPSPRALLPGGVGLFFYYNAAILRQQQQNGRRGLHHHHHDASPTASANYLRPNIKCSTAIDKSFLTSDYVKSDSIQPPAVNRLTPFAASPSHLPLASVSPRLSSIVGNSPSAFPTPSSGSLGSGTFQMSPNLMLLASPAMRLSAALQNILDDSDAPHGGPLDLGTPANSSANLSSHSRFTLNSHPYATGGGSESTKHRPLGKISRPSHGSAAVASSCALNQVVDSSSSNAPLSFESVGNGDGLPTARNSTASTGRSGGLLGMILHRKKDSVQITAVDNSSSV